MTCFINAARLDMSFLYVISELSEANLLSSFILDQNPSEFYQPSRFNSSLGKRLGEVEMKGCQPVLWVTGED